MILPQAPTFLDALGTGATHADAEHLLLNAGWAPCGAGDWAFALAAPEGDVVARISRHPGALSRTRPGRL